MKFSTALFMSGSLLCLAIPMAHADDEPVNLPDGYDLSTLSRGPSKVTPGLEPPRNVGDTATILSVAPTAKESGAARIEWSGYVLMGLSYKNSRTR